MQAFQIAYSSDDRLVALGWPTGLVEVAEVGADGWPAARVAVVPVHRKEIVFVGFAGADRLVSVDDGGRVVVSAVPGGEALVEARVGKENVQAGLSPDGRTLFAFAYREAKGTNTFAVDVATGRVTWGPHVRRLSVQVRVFGLSADRAAYYHLHDRERKRGGGEEVVQALEIVDFTTGEITARELSGGPHSTFGDLPPLDLDVVAGVGARLGYAHPVEQFQHDGHPFLGLLVEVFDAATLAPRRTVMALGRAANEHAGLAKLLRKKAPSGAAYREALDDLLQHVTTIRIVDGGRAAWIGIKGGAIRRLDLVTGTRGPLLLHGRIAEPRGMTLDDVFARNVQNNQTLGASASGALVAFGNPNQFVRAAAIDPAEPSPVTLASRADPGAVAPPPDYLALVDGGGALALGLDHPYGANVGIVDLATGAASFALRVPYGDELRAVSRSPSGRELLLAYAGRASLRVRPDDAQPVVALPLPPHTVFAAHLADDRAVLVHDQGAVISLVGDSLHAFRGAPPTDPDDDEDGDDEDGDDEGDDDAGDDDAGMAEVEGDGDGEAMDPDADGADVVPWQLINPPGVEPLMIVGNFEGEFIYNDYFEQRDPVYGVARARIADADHVVVLVEGGTLAAYRIGAERIDPAFLADVPARHRVCAGGARAAVYELDGGAVDVFDLAADGCRLRLAFTGADLRLVALTADGRELVVLDDETGVCSVRDLESGRERAVFAYLGPALERAVYDPASDRVVLVETTGALIVVDLHAGAVVGTLRVLPVEPPAAPAAPAEPGEAAEPTDDVIEPEDATAPAPLRVEVGVVAVGRVERRDTPVVRALLGAAEIGDRDAERAERSALFGHGPTIPGGRALAKRIEAALDRYKKLGKKRLAERVLVFADLLAPFEAGPPEAAPAGEPRRDVGRCFTIRGCVHVEAGALDAARADFMRGLRFGYERAHEEVVDLARLRGDHAAAVRAADRVLVDHAARKGIGLRQSLGIYRPYLSSLVALGAAERARYVLRLLVEELAGYLNDDEADAPRRGKGRTAKIAARLAPVTAALAAARTGPAGALAGQLAAQLAAALAAYPPEVPDDDAAADAARALLARVQFLTSNDRGAEVPAVVDAALAPHVGQPYYGSPHPTPVLHRLGELFGARGLARRSAGDVRGAAADLAQAIEYREPCHYRDLVDLQLGPLADPEAAIATCARFFTSPFLWPSEYYTPVEPLDHAHMLASRALARRRLGRPAALTSCRRLYPGELARVADRLGAAHSAAAPHVAALIAELRAAAEGARR